LKKNVRLHRTAGRKKFPAQKKRLGQSPKPLCCKIASPDVFTFGSGPNGKFKRSDAEGSAAVVVAFADADGFVTVVLQDEKVRRIQNMV
jgi:hypothetical protein